MMDPCIKMINRYHRSYHRSCHGFPFVICNLAEADWYSVLQVAETASAAEIKAAYHKALLQNHPDKNGSSMIDIATIKTAYQVLGNPTDRALYDIKSKTGPRPAQVVSLDDFVEHNDDGQQRWSYRCRCGGQYHITDSDLEKGIHIVGCLSCSEVIWVGYEEVQEDDQGYHPSTGT